MDLLSHPPASPRGTFSRKTPHSLLVTHSMLKQYFFFYRENVFIAVYNSRLSPSSITATGFQDFLHTSPALLGGTTFTLSFLSRNYLLQGLEPSGFQAYSFFHGYASCSWYQRPLTLFPPPRVLLLCPVLNFGFGIISPPPPVCRGVFCVTGTYICVHITICGGGASWCLHDYCFVLKHGFSLAWNLTNRLCYCVSKPCSSVCLHFPSAGIMSMCHHIPHFSFCGF